MRAFISILSILSFTTAFLIPKEKSTDGVYSVQTLADGTNIITRLTEIKPRDRPATFLNDAQVLKRQEGPIYCGCGFNMDPWNCDAAVDALKAQLVDAIINPGLAYYSIHDNVVAFICNRTPSTLWGMTAGSYAACLSKITGACGLYVAGTIEAPDYGLLSGYMRYAEGDDFCTASTASSARSC